MTTQNRKIGDFGEKIAVMFLKKHNFSILGKNYLKKGGEIDIIAEKDGTIHFVEVKTILVVNHETSYRPEENVYFDKLKKIHTTIQKYRAEHGPINKWQVDVVAIELDKINKKTRIRHIFDVVL